MHIALAQLNYHVGNFESNVAKVVHTIARAKEMGADLVVFSELSICGYPPRDFLEFDDFIEKCEESIATIAANCIGIAAIIGAPCRNKTGKGKPLFNSAYFLACGNIRSVHHKSLLPNYDVFDEYRYFEPSTEVQSVNYKNTNIAITVCEDLWNAGDNHLYTYCPMDHLAKQNPGLIVNISASPFSYTHREERLAVFSKNASRYNVPLVFVNHVDAQTELIFDGGSFVINREGKLAAELEYFKEDLKVFNLDVLPEKPELHSYMSKEQRIFSALSLPFPYSQNHNKRNPKYYKFQKI